MVTLINTLMMVSQLHCCFVHKHCAHEVFHLVLKKVQRSTPLLHWEVAKEKAFFHPSRKHLRSNATADHGQEENKRHYSQTPQYYHSTSPNNILLPWYNVFTTSLLPLTQGWISSFLHLVVVGRPLFPSFLLPGPCISAKTKSATHRSILQKCQINESGKKNSS